MMNHQQVLTGAVFNESSCHPSLFSQLRRLPIGHFKHLTGVTTHGVIRRDPRVIDGFKARKATIQKETTRFLMVFAHEILPVQESPQYRSSSPQIDFSKGDFIALHIWHIWAQNLGSEAQRSKPLVICASSPWKDPPFLSSVNHLFLWAMASMANWHK